MYRPIDHLDYLKHFVQVAGSTKDFMIAVRDKCFFVILVDLLHHMFVK